MKRVLCYVTVFVVVVGALVLVAVWPSQGSGWLYVPVFAVPVIGLWWVCFWIRELLEPKATRYRGPAALAFVFTSFLIIGALFALGFFAAGKLGGQLVSDHCGCQTDGPNCMYFSIVTATTLGYGDLCPTGWARFVACAEVVVFVTYIGAGGGLLARCFQKQ